MLFIFINFIILLLLSNAFLFKAGLWLYQDQSFWFKNSLEAFAFFNTQVHAFSNLSYYLGYDQGILSANNTFVYGIFLALYHMFGSSGSQIAVSLLSYILAFFSFWAFASLFFNDKKLQGILALLYTFNPLMYSFRGQGIIYAAAPLFVYSFYKFYISEKNTGKFLLLNIFSSFLWVANVRFLQGNLFIIVPYLFFLLLVLQKPRLYLKKLLLYFVINVFVFSPVIYSLFAPLFQKLPSIFNYGTVFNGFVVSGPFYEVFNPFQSFNVILYDNRIYTLLGIGFFIAFLLLLLKFFKKNISIFLTLNLALLVLGLTFFELGTVAGKGLYPVLIKFFPFLTNEPYYGLYIVNIPFIFLMGVIGVKQRKALLLLSSYFIVLSLLPLLHFSSFPLQKYSLNNLPTPYQNYFVKPFYGIPEATDYIPFDCWRAQYMNQANIPTQCINRGIHYPSILYDNPRVISGQEYYLVNSLYLNPNVEDLRITHNLKNIIVANDIVNEVDAGPLYDEQDIARIKQINVLLKKNKLLSLQSNKNFNVFSFKNKDSYDFFLYSPQKIIVKDSINSIFDNSLQLNPRPVVLSKNTSNQIDKNLQQNVKITYKQSQFDPTQYFLKLDSVSMDKQFMIQLTQAYKSGWELVWINKKEYESKHCIDNPVFYPLTNNTICQYKSSLFDTSMLSFLTKESVDPKYHFQGNYVSNTWLIKPNTIPQYAKEGNEVYAVIVYKNQIYLLLTFLVAASVLLFVIIYTLMQEGKKLLKRK